MKEKCDNHCETCPMQTQVHCAVVHSRAAYVTATTIVERLIAIEQSLHHEAPALINPLANEPITDSAILPAQEQGETIKPIQPL